MVERSRRLKVSPTSTIIYFDDPAPWVLSFFIIESVIKSSIPITIHSLSPSNTTTTTPPFVSHENLLLDLLYLPLGEVARGKMSTGRINRLGLDGRPIREWLSAPRTSNHPSATTSRHTNTSNANNRQLGTRDPSQIKAPQHTNTHTNTGTNTDGGAATFSGHPNMPPAVSTQSRSVAAPCYCDKCLPFLTGKKIQYDLVTTAKWVPKFAEREEVVVMKPKLVNEWVLRKEFHHHVHLQRTIPGP